MGIWDTIHGVMVVGSSNVSNSTLITCLPHPPDASQARLELWTPFTVLRSKARAMHNSHAPHASKARLDIWDTIDGVTAVGSSNVYVS